MISYYLELERSDDLVPPERLPYMRGLDGLRAIAVMAVVFYHADFAWATGGFLGVEVFFVISGYLITSLLLVEWLGSGTIDLKNFWLRRARRLLPAVVTLLVVVSIASILFYRDALDRLLGDVVAAMTYVTNWFFIFRQESYFEAFGRPPVLRHLWSLGVEEQFYVLWPLIFTFGLAILGKGRGHKGTLRRFGMLVAAGITSSTALMFLLYTPYEDPSRVYYGTDTRATGILIGVLLALVWMPWKLPEKIAPAHKVSTDTIGWIAIAVLLYILGNLSEFSPSLYRGGFLLTSLVTAVAIAATVHPGASLGKILDNPVMKWFGTRSYGIYLWHWPIFMILRPGFDVPWATAPTFAVRLALTFTISELSYRYIETPIRHDGFRAWVGGIRRTLGITSARAATSFALAVAGVAVVIGAGLVQGAVVRTTSIVASPGDEGPSTILAPTSTTTSPRETPTPVTDDRATEASEMPAAAPISETTATAAPTTSTTLTPPPPEPQTPPVVPAPPTPSTVSLPSVTMIGDSVMLGAEGALLATLPNAMNFDAAISRQFKQAAAIIGDLRALGELGDIVVVHLGTNGAFSSSAFDNVMAQLQDRDRVIVLNAKVTRRWESVVNNAIETGAQRWPNVQIVDWNGFAGTRPELFTRDQVHLNPEGQVVYAELLNRVINRS